MQFHDEWRQLSKSRAGIRSRALAVVIKTLAIVFSILMLIGAIAVSIVFFAGVLLIGLAVGGYVWWRTRDVRAQVRAAQRDAAQGDSQIIEGEVIRKRVTDDKDES